MQRAPSLAFGIGGRQHGRPLHSLACWRTLKDGSHFKARRRARALRVHPAARAVSTAERSSQRAGLRWRRGPAELLTRPAAAATDPLPARRIRSSFGLGVDCRPRLPFDSAATVGANLTWRFDLHIYRIDWRSRILSAASERGWQRRQLAPTKLMPSRSTRGATSTVRRLRAGTQVVVMAIRHAKVRWSTPRGSQRALRLRGQELPADSTAANR